MRWLRRRASADQVGPACLCHASERHSSGQEEAERVRVGGIEQDHVAHIRSDEEIADGKQRRCAGPDGQFAVGESCTASAYPGGATLRNARAEARVAEPEVRPHGERACGELVAALGSEVEEM